MDSQPRPNASRYWLCAAGFWIAGLALALLSVSGAMMLWTVITRDQGLWVAMQMPWFTWGIELPITAGALTGSYLLWGRWTDSNWQRRAGLLVLLNLFDSLHWGLSQAAQMGVEAANLGHPWLAYNLVMIFGWIEFILFLGLSSEVASHLGVRAALDAGRTARQFSVAGLAVSILYLVTQTRWQAGWPLIPGPMPNLSDELMKLGVMFLRVIAGMQVATLCVMAGISCRRTARDLASQEDPAGPHPSFDGSGLRDPDWDRAAQRDDFPW
jgi:hypothetical protein